MTSDHDGGLSPARLKIRDHFAGPPDPDRAVRLAHRESDALSIGGDSCSSGVSRPESGRKSLAQSCLEPGSGRFHDAVAPNDDGPVNRREFADRFPHRFVQNVAILFRIALERIEDHLFGLLQNMAVIAHDEQSADLLSLPTVLAEIKRKAEYAVKNHPLDVFVDGWLVGGVEQLVFRPQRHHHQRVDERTVRSGEKDHRVVQVDKPVRHRDDGVVRDQSPPV